MLKLLPSFLIFLGLNFLLFSTANTIIWRYYESELRDVFDWVILFFVFTAAELLLVLGTIGFLGQLNLSWMIAGTVLCYVLGVVSLPFLGKAKRLGTFAAWAKLRHLLFRHERPDGHDWVWGIFGFLVLFGAVELFNALIQFPWEYDTIAYHMPIVIEWLQLGSLWEVFYAVWGGPLGYYPSNHELMLSWLILPFGKDYLVNIANFWVVGVLIVVIYKILKEMGVRDFLAWLAGALVMVMPIFLRQVGTGQVDILMALGIVIAWYFFLRSYKRKDGVLLIPVLLTIALTLGTKYLAVIYVIPILVVFFFLWHSWRKTYRYWWLWFLLLLGTLGSMWYWRNLVLTGNPLFPADVRFGDLVLFQGYTGLTERIQGLSLWARITESGELSKWLTTMVKETGWHLYLVVIAYALLIFEMIYKLLFSKMKRGEGKIYTLMLFFLPAYWYLYFIAPYTASMMEHNVRYAMPWLMLSMIMVVFVVYKMGTARKAFVIALMGVIWWQFLTLVPAQRLGDQPFLDLQFVYQYPWHFFWLFLVLLFALLWFEAWRRRYWWRYGVIILTLGLGFTFFQQVTEIRTEVRAQAWQQKYSFPLMKAYEWLDAHVEADAAIANSLNPLYYPLYGQDLSRRVRYININSCGTCDYFSYQQEGLTVRDNATYEAWLQNLKDFGTDYVVLGYSIRTGLEAERSYELEWVKEHPEVFELVFEEEEVFVYRITGNW